MTNQADPDPSDSPTPDQTRARRIDEGDEANAIERAPAPQDLWLYWAFCSAHTFVRNIDAVRKALREAVDLLTHESAARQQAERERGELRAAIYPDAPSSVLHKGFMSLAVSYRERAEAAESRDVLTAPMAAGLMLKLKEECEAQHARAEAAESSLTTLRAEVEGLREERDYLRECLVAANGPIRTSD